MRSIYIHCPGERYATTISKNLLAYLLLKSANFASRDEQLINTTKLGYESVKSNQIKSQMKKHFLINPNNQYKKLSYKYHKSRTHISRQQ